MKRLVPVVLFALALSGPVVASAATTPANADFVSTEVAKFTSPWAMTFLPDGRLLVAEMEGTLHLVDPSTRNVGAISGVPRVWHVAPGRPR